MDDLKAKAAAADKKYYDYYTHYGKISRQPMLGMPALQFFGSPAEILSHLRLREQQIVEMKEKIERHSCDKHIIKECEEVASRIDKL